MGGNDYLSVIFALKGRDHQLKAIQVVLSRLLKTVDYRIRDAVLFGNFGLFDQVGASD